MKDAASFPTLLEMFFTRRLIAQRRASPHTIASYRDTFRLLLKFAEKRLAKVPSGLTMEDLNAPFLGAFLDHLESTRANGARSRNLRLTAIRSFFRYAALETPQHSGLIQRVLAIPNKRQPRPLVGFLTRPEIDALLAAPARDRWLGRRDHALLLTVVQTGLRLAEITSIRQQDVSLAMGAHVRCEGKGRKERCTPLTKSTVIVLTHGSGNKVRMAHESSFPARAVAGSAPTRFSIWSRSTLQPHNRHVHHWPTSVSRRMFFATPRRWS
jgi:integrase/recombinase XerD